MLTTPDIEAIPLSTYRELAQRLFMRGRVTAHKELRLQNYPQLTNDEQRRCLKCLGAIPNIGVAYLDIERCLKDQPPVVRGLLWTLYGKRHAQLHEVPLEVEPSYRLHISDFIDCCYGDLISEGERRTLERVASRIKSTWCRHAIHQLGLVELEQPAGAMSKAA